MYFHTNDEHVIFWLRNLFVDLTEHGANRLRIEVEGGRLKVKVNEGTWSAPIESTPDPYRDES